MKTKSDLLAVMAEHKACREATEYVTDHTSDSAEEIGLSCDQIDWLIWLLVRESVNLTDFVNGCAERAEGYAAIYVAVHAADYAVGVTRYAADNVAAYVVVYVAVYAADYADCAAIYAANAAGAAARSARYAARGAANAAGTAADSADYADTDGVADYSSAECRLQLEQLRDLWKKWCRA